METVLAVLITLFIGDAAGGGFGEFGADGLGVDGFRRDGFVSEDRQAIVSHLRNSAVNHQHALVAALQVETQRADAKLGEQGRAAGQNSDLSIVRWNNGLDDSLIQNLLFGGHDNALKGHGYFPQIRIGGQSRGRGRLRQFRFIRSYNALRKTGVGIRYAVGIGITATAFARWFMFWQASIYQEPYMQIVSAEEKATLEKKREELYKMQIDVQERIRKAAALGDLSENAEYHFAKEENRTIQRQLAELEDKLRHVAVVSNEHVPDGLVFSGTRSSSSIWMTIPSNWCESWGGRAAGRQQ